MEKTENDIVWVQPLDVPDDIRRVIDPLHIRTIGVCRLQSVVMAEIDSRPVCPEIIDGFCGGMEECPHGPDAVAADIMAVLFQDHILTFLRDAGLLSKIRDDHENLSSEDTTARKQDRFARMAFAKLKFELTRKIAQEHDDISFLSRALLEEFGIGRVPLELETVFDLEVKHRKAAARGMTLRDYLIHEAGESIQKTVNNARRANTLIHYQMF